MAYNSLCIYEISLNVTIFVTTSAHINQFLKGAPGSPLQSSVANHGYDTCTYDTFRCPKLLLQRVIHERVIALCYEREGIYLN
jgi:hypothetical protein